MTEVDPRRVVTVGMIHTAETLLYTQVAIASLRQHTSIPYRLVVIDNDGIHKEQILALGADECLTPERGPASFAQNANQLIRHAAPGDLVLANNDLYFLPQWLQTLKRAAMLRPGLISPRSNWDTYWESRPPLYLTLRPSMTLEEVRGHEEELAAFAKEIRRNFLGQTRHLPRALLHLCYIPAEIGRDYPLDESFQNGGEDEDLTIRAHLANVPIYQPLDSFVLHFSNRSFASEGEKRRAERLARCSGQLREKWGDPTAFLIMTGGGQQKLLQLLGIEDAWSRGEYAQCVQTVYGGC